MAHISLVEVMDTMNLYDQNKGLKLRMSYIKDLLISIAVIIHGLY